MPARNFDLTAAMPHPLDPLTPAELSDISHAIRAYALEHQRAKRFKFIQASLLPPKKVDVLDYLGIIPTATSLAGPLLRRADVDFIDPLNGCAFNVLLDLEDNNWTVRTFIQLPDGVEPQITPEELNRADEAVRRDANVIKFAAEVGVNASQICADGWSIGYDDRFGRERRLQQCMVFARFEPHENLYAHPLDFFPVLDSNTFEVIHIDFAPHRTKGSGGLSASTAPPPLNENAFEVSGRERIEPPTRKFEYLPDISGIILRDDLKPLHIIQPEGPSFRINGHELEWQKWKMHVAFSGREGIAISTVTYNDKGKVRPLFYRLSLVEMVVPYGAPEFPHARKFAFDVGEYGMGTQANDLSLGCDCLGTVHYMPGTYMGHSGKAVTIKHAICIHEEELVDKHSQDLVVLDGLLWKHTDYRPNGRSHAVRSRRLVISMVCTVANYEYALYYYFYQDGTIGSSIRLTGVLNTYVLAPGESSAPFGTTVAPQITAHYHQHIFSLRLDPMIDGLKNSVIETDVVSLAAKTGSADNYAGNGFTIESRTIQSEGEGARAYDAVKDRRWTIVNKQKCHYASGKPVGYTLAVRGACVELLGKADSWVAKRAAFATKALWVVRDADDDKRVWPAGRYVPQTQANPEDSVLSWCQGEESVDGEDIVIFLTTGINHIPRPEDFPVMPKEELSIQLRPVHFFDVNPALDVPATKDLNSVLAFPDAHSTDMAADIIPSGSTGVCCS